MRQPIILLTLAMTLLAPGGSFAGDANKPHPHQGRVPRPPAQPTPTALNANQEASLASGKPVLTQKRYDDLPGGRGVAIMDVHAPIEDVWSTIESFTSYPTWIDQVDVCEPYKRAGDHVFVRFVLNTFGVDVEYFVDHIVAKDRGFISWTLDYSRESDLDDSAGYWLVRAHPSKAGWTRVEYSVDLMVASWVPTMVASSITERGLRDATKWLPTNAEARAHARGAW